MLLSKSVSENSSDFYGLWRGYTESVFTNIERTIPQYHQSITNFLQESVEIWKNIACSSIDLQNRIVRNAGLKTNMPESAVKISRDITKESTKAIDVQNKIVIASIDATKESLGTLNANAGEFSSINNEIVDLLPSVVQARS